MLTDAFLAFPPLVFLLALVTVLEPSLSTIFVAFALLGIPTVVRLARANSLSLTERDWVLCVRSRR